MWHCFRDPMFSSFGTIQACDKQTDRQTDRQTHARTTTVYTVLAQSLAVKTQSSSLINTSNTNTGLTLGSLLSRGSIYKVIVS